MIILASALYLFEGIGSPRRNVEESATRLENIPFTMVLHNNTDGL